MPYKHQTESYRNGGKFICWCDCFNGLRDENKAEAKRIVSELKAQGKNAFYRSLGNGEYRVFTSNIR